MNCPDFARGFGWYASNVLSSREPIHVFDTLIESEQFVRSFWQIENHGWHVDWIGPVYCNKNGCNRQATYAELREKISREREIVDHRKRLRDGVDLVNGVIVERWRD